MQKQSKRKGYFSLQYLEYIPGWASNRLVYAAIPIWRCKQKISVAHAASTLNANHYVKENADSNETSKMDESQELLIHISN